MNGLDTTETLRRIGFDRLRFLVGGIEPKPAPGWGLAARLWACPAWAVACLMFLAAAALIVPPDGYPFRFCFFYNLTGVDCPSCGLTRAVAHLWRGNVLEAVKYHWFSPAVFLYLVAHASFLMLPVRAREKGVRFLNRHNQAFVHTGICASGAFFVYGFGRAIWQIWNRWGFTF